MTQTAFDLTSALLSRWDPEGAEFGSIKQRVVCSLLRQAVTLELVRGGGVSWTASLPPRQASWLVEHARASGLSYGTYLASVIDGSPAPGGLGEAVRALTASTNQLAALSTDLNDFVRLLRQGRSAEAEKYRQRVSSLFDDVRQHMRLNAALSAEIRAAVRWRTAKANPS